MKVYVHQGNGHWIGSCAVVLADGPLEACDEIRKLLDEAGLQGEAVTIQGLREFSTDKPAVIVFDDGDY